MTDESPPRVGEDVRARLEEVVYSVLFHSRSQTAAHGLRAEEVTDAILREFPHLAAGLAEKGREHDGLRPREMITPLGSEMAEHLVANAPEVSLRSDAVAHFDAAWRQGLERGQEYLDRAAGPAEPDVKQAMLDRGWRLGSFDEIAAELERLCCTARTYAAHLAAQDPVPDVPDQCWCINRAAPSRPVPWRTRKDVDALRAELRAAEAEWANAAALQKPEREVLATKLISEATDALCDAVAAGGGTDG